MPSAKVDKITPSDIAALGNAALPNEGRGPAASLEQKFGELLMVLPPEKALKLWELMLHPEAIEDIKPELLRELRKRPGTARLDLK